MRKGSTKRKNGGYLVVGCLGVVVTLGLLALMLEDLTSMKLGSSRIKDKRDQRAQRQNKVKEIPECKGGGTHWNDRKCDEIFHNDDDNGRCRFQLKRCQYACVLHPDGSVDKPKSVDIGEYGNTLLLNKAWMIVYFDLRKIKSPMTATIHGSLLCSTSISGGFPMVPYDQSKESRVLPLNHWPITNGTAYLCNGIPRLRFDDNFNYVMTVETEMIDKAPYVLMLRSRIMIKNVQPLRIVILHQYKLKNLGITITRLLNPGMLLDLHFMPVGAENVGSQWFYNGMVDDVRDGEVRKGHKIIIAARDEVDVSSELSYKDEDFEFCFFLQSDKMT